MVTVSSWSWGGCACQSPCESVIISRRTSSASLEIRMVEGLGSVPSSPESTGLVRMDVGQHALASYQSATLVALSSDSYGALTHG